MEEEMKQENPVTSTTPASTSGDAPPFKVLEVVIVVAVIILGTFYYVYYKQSGGPALFGDGVAKSIDDFNKNDLEGAIKNADNVLAKDPNNINALLLKSASLAQQGSLRFQEEEFGTQAIAVADQALSVDSENAEAWRIKGYAYESMQEYDQAFAAYNKAISLDPQNALAYASRGHAYYLIGNYVRAKADQQKALSIDPDLTLALSNLGRIFITEGDYAGATSNLNKALSLETNVRFKAEIEGLLGSIDIIQGNFASAKTHYQNSLNYDQTLAASWVGLANAKFLTLPKVVPKDQASIDAFSASVASIFSDLEKATKINPNQTSAYVITGRLLGALGENEAALGVLRHALEVVDNDITLGTIEKGLVRETIQSDIAFISN